MNFTEETPDPQVRYHCTVITPSLGSLRQKVHESKINLVYTARSLCPLPIKPKRDPKKHYSTLTKTHFAKPLGTYSAPIAKFWCAKVMQKHSQEYLIICGSFNTLKVCSNF